MRRKDTDQESRRLRFRLPAASGDLTHEPGTTDEALTRWLRADSLRALAASVFDDLHNALQITRLAIVAWHGERRGDWVVYPPGDEIGQLIDAACEPPGSETVEDGPVTVTTPVDPRLRRAGFQDGFTVITTHHIQYSFFYGARSGAALPPVSEHPLVRALEPVLENMARLEHWRALSHVDPITEVFNRRYFDLRLAEEAARSHRFARPLSLALLDIDNLKAINDRYGHPMGDSVLRRTARCARRAIRSIDVFCRVGGDEFAILMPDADLTQNPGFGERLCSVLTRRHTAANEVPGEVTVTVSMGAAVMPIHGNDPEQLLWCADLALLNAKHDRRGRFLLYDSSLELPHSSSSETR